MAGLKLQHIGFSMFQPRDFPFQRICWKKALDKEKKNKMRVIVLIFLINTYFSATIFPTFQLARRII